MQLFSGGGGSRFGGGESYLAFYESLEGGSFWAGASITLSVAMVLGCLVIAWQWRRQARLLSRSEPRRAMVRLGRLFLVCSVTGFAWVALAVSWPGGRPMYCLLMLALVAYVWYVAWRRKDLRRLRRRLNRMDQLLEDLQDARHESRHKSFYLNALGHDLRNPLYALTLQVEMVDSNLLAGRPDEARKALTLIRQCAHETNDLLDNFLELGRLDWSQEDLDSQPMDLVELLRSSVAAMMPSASKKGLDLQLQCPSMLAVQTDRRKLDRVLSNLLSNAIKYTDQGHVRVRVEARDKWVHIEVIDSGPGIPPEQRQNIFDEFYQLDIHASNRQKGHGLGLTIVRRLVDRLEGRIEVESELGEGSCFRVVLPKVLRRKERTHAEPEMIVQ